MVVQQKTDLFIAALTLNTLTKVFLIIPDTLG